MATNVARTLDPVNNPATIATVIPLTGQATLLAMRRVRDWKAQAAPKAVLQALLLRANDHGAAWPSVATIAADTGQSPSTVQRALRSIEADTTCPIVLERHFVTGCSTTYRLGLREDSSPVPTPVMVTPTPVMVTVDPGHGDTQSPQDRPNEVKKARARPGVKTRAKREPDRRARRLPDPDELHAAVGRPVHVQCNPLAAVGLEGIAGILAALRG